MDLADERGAFADAERAGLMALVEQLGASLDVLLEAPVRQDALALSYCPKCHCEYRIGAGRCSDCDVELESFQAADEFA